MSKSGVKEDYRLPTTRSSVISNRVLVKDETPKQPIIQQAVSDEDFSNILGGQIFFKQTTIEVTSECSQEDDGSPERKDNRRKNYTARTKGASTANDTSEMNANGQTQELN